MTKFSFKLITILTVFALVLCNNLLLNTLTVPTGSHETAHETTTQHECPVDESCAKIFTQTQQDGQISSSDQVKKSSLAGILLSNGPSLQAQLALLSRLHGGNPPPQYLSSNHLKSRTVFLL